MLSVLRKPTSEGYGTSNSGQACSHVHVSENANAELCLLLVFLFFFCESQLGTIVPAFLIARISVQN